MDLGCLDLGCISVSDKLGNEAAVHDSSGSTDVASHRPTSASKIGKNNRSPKGTGQSALNKFTSQIKKPSHRKTSPMNWFPRKKADSYLKRKIKMLQEVDGMNLTLDETLGDSNPHYCRVLREKIAAREAAHRAMEARKAALVEASWCRILQAARIQSKEAEALLLKAEKTAAEAFEAAIAMGVIMHDTPNCPKKFCQIETSIAKAGGKSTTHTVTASFETAFDVDKQVAAAVKTAFVRLASCPSFDKDEFKDLLRKISQNPDMGDNSQKLSECESESVAEPETMHQHDGLGSEVMDCKFNVVSLVDMMLERLRCLKEEELSSLATIVATCGLNAALAEVESSKLNAAGTTADCSKHEALSIPAGNYTGTGAIRSSNLASFMGEHVRRKQSEPELPSLDKFLVKHMTKLEREVQEAKNSSRNGINNGDQEITGKADTDRGSMNAENGASVETVPDLGSFLVKHSSKLEKEIEEAKKNSGRDFEIVHKKPPVNGLSSSSEVVPDLGSVLTRHSSRLEKETLEERNFRKRFSMNGKESEKTSNGFTSRRKDVPHVPSLDQYLVKHVSRLEKEVQEAKNRRKNGTDEEGSITNVDQKVDSSTLASKSNKNTSVSCNRDVLAEKENVDSNKKEDGKSEMDKKESSKQIKQTGGTLQAQDSLVAAANTEDGLDKILVKPVHRLEREKMEALSVQSNYKNHRNQNKHGGNATATEFESLDKVLVKHVPRLEKEKMKNSLKEEEALKVKKSCRNGRFSQMNEEGTTPGFDQILMKHKSRMEMEKEVASAAQKPEEQMIKLSVSRREARQRELEEAWGGLSLGNSMKPHFSRLERDKAAWIKAEEEERRRANEV